MIDVKAKIIGIKVILTGVLIGLLTAIFIMAWIGGFGSLTDLIKGLWLNLSVALLALFYFGYLFGEKAGSDIIVKKKNSFWIAFKTSFFTLMLGTFFGSMVGFLSEGLPDESFIDAGFNYIFKPFYWVLFFGIPFLLIISGFLGWRIKYLGKNIEEETM